MTGQILGGSSVFDAARYQILIIYLIAACSFSTIYMQLFFVLQICFDSRMILRIDRLKKRQVKPNAVTLIKSLWNASTNVRYQNSHSRQDHPRNLLSSSSSTFPSTVEESRCLSPNGELSVKIASKDNDQADQADQVSIDVLQLTFSFETK